MLDINDALDIIEDNKVVAVVGLSPKTDRPSYTVGNFLKERGYQLIPINPGPHEKILGETNKMSLSNLSPDEADWLDLFVNPARLTDLLPEIIRLNPKLVWCQIGVVNDTFNKKLDEAGIPYVADVCPKIELAK